MRQYYGKETGYVSEKEISATKNRMLDDMIAEELKDEIIPEGDQEAARELCLEYGGPCGGIIKEDDSRFGHYLVHGATLQCDQIKKRYGKVTTNLCVLDNQRCINGRKMATVLDRDFAPFNVVCPYEETGGEERSCEELIWKADKWENIIRNTSYMTYECEGESAPVEGLTMMSMLLCKHGGIITPVDSGQIVLEYELKNLTITKNQQALTNTSLEPASIFNLEYSTQYKIQKLCKLGNRIYFDKDGYQRVGNVGVESDPYLVALAQYYFDEAVSAGVGNEQGYGAIFLVKLSSGKEIFVTLGDLKAPKDTKASYNEDGKNLYAGSGKNANTIEFICNYNNRNADYYSENMDSRNKNGDRYHGKALTVMEEASIESIQLLIGAEIPWGDYYEDAME